MISYIITTFNRGEKVLKTIQSILRQIPNQDEVEIVVVDGGSKDNTCKLVQDLADKVSNVRLIIEKAPGVMPSRHAGAKLAKGNILVYIEDDVQVSETHVKAIKEIFSDNQNQIATGPCEPDYLSTDFPIWYQSMWSTVSSIPNSKVNGWFSLMNLGDKVLEVDASYVWALNFAIRKTLLFELGGFHPDLSPPRWKAFQGDGESGLSLKASEKNISAIYHPGLKVLHEIQADRFDTKYVERRLFFQGISDSFTLLRKTRAVASLFSHYLALTLLSLRLAKRKIFRNELPVDLISEKARLKGFLFHQRSFRDDLKVQSWVLEESYIDKAVPEPSPIRFFDKLFLMV
ncbi:glycosyltransferase family 2 protein [Leptospira mtsangambouensis]|uniref:Glycosyltransferase family 2 protein n=1 Tax=Leptospira mtsangambouensis TaxID=2484912 RepID=A0ABY2P456_9LEPT|nr:glycosyltransferase family 2 protein [Leptospira mtsangambouensis]TGM82263.1 glycosyltransferase family 2 protein [Leptospira mtsangambouensis]